MKVMGIDYSLTHYGLVIYDYKLNTVDVLEQHKINPYAIKYKKHTLEEARGTLRVFTNLLRNYATEYNINAAVIDFSAHVYFNAGKIQTVYSSFATGYMLAQFDRNMTQCFLLTPKEVRSFANLNAKTVKKDVQDWYLHNTKLGDILNISKQSEDVIDATILAFLIATWLSDNDLTQNVLDRL